MSITDSIDTSLIDRSTSPSDNWFERVEQNQAITTIPSTNDFTRFQDASFSTIQSLKTEFERRELNVLKKAEEMELENISAMIVELSKPCDNEV
jgi:hypothetical protein